LLYNQAAQEKELCWLKPKAAVQFKGGGFWLYKNGGMFLCGGGDPAVVGSFRENAAAIERVVNDFAHSGGVGVDIHALTGAQMANNPFGGNLQRRAAQFGVATGLDMVNPQKAVMKWNISAVQSHFYSP
jgi:hypothetical protein